MPTPSEAKVIESIAEVFENKGVKPPPLGAETRLDASLGLDSLDFAELVVRLEAQFGADPFSQGAPTPVRTIGQLAKLYEEALYEQVQ
ncbi:MAG TPA: acyl carrier protein [Anaeromyxobacter sp.]